MADSILADAYQEEDTHIQEDTVFNVGQDEQENETPESSPEKTNEEEESPSHQGEQEPTTEEPNTDDVNNLPFHKHPAWLERKQQWDDKMAQKDRELQELREKVEQVVRPVKNEQVTIPDWFKGIYGDDTNAWNSYQTDQAAERARIKQELIQEQQQVQRAQEERVQRWEQYQTESINRLRDEGKEFDKNELMDIMYKYRPTDDLGNFDFTKGYELLTAIKATKVNPEKSKARKDIADISPSKSTPDTKRDYSTANDFRGKSIYDIVRE